MTLKKLILYVVSLVVVVVGYLFWSINYVNAPSISELTLSIEKKEQTLFNQVIPDTDLPPDGTRSLFDHLIAQNDGLPYPFSEFLTLLKDANPEGETPLTVLIPHGRSLLKGQANEVLPRIVLASDFQQANTPVGLGMATQGQLFMGFVEAANEIEVVSYNEAAGRFEYQLVQNYCEGCVPRIVYARRAICLTCHQGGTPIFSQRPWNETNGQLKISSKIQEAMGVETHYSGVPIQQPLAAPERFDELTDIGNFLMASQRVWLDGCGEMGNECRRKLLYLALSFADQPGLFDVEGVEVQGLKKLWENSFPKNGIMVPESDLQNRDPTGENNSFTDWLYALFTPDIDFGDGAKDNEDLTSFEKLPPLPPLLDPLTLRAPKKILYKTDIDGVFGLARFFTDSDMDSLNEHYAYDMQAVLNKVKQLPDDAFNPKPFSRVKMMGLLLQSEQQYCCLNTEEMSPPRASGIPELAIEKFPELHLFQEYCFACHRGNPAKRLDFMSGDNEDVVLERIQENSDIREALDWERYLNTDKAAILMPPMDSVQYSKLNEASGSPREKMREAVPSMFGF